MRILFLNSAPIITYGLAAGFEKNGVVTSILTPNQQNIQGFKNALDTFKPDFVLMEGGIDSQEWVFPVVEEGVPLIYWGIEDPIWLDTLSMEWAEHAVLVATPCWEAVEKYQANGHHALCVPFAVNPDWYYRRDTQKYAHLDAVLIANNYNYYDTRYEAYQYLLQPFIDHSKNLEVYGLDWDNPDFKYRVPEHYYKGYMPYEETVLAYSSAKMVLGVHSVIDSRTMQSMRTFEILGCGGFFFSSYAKALEEMFINHRHLVFSRSREETEVYMDYYLRNEEARQKIALEGQKFVYENHTYEQRAKQIIEALEEM